MRSLIDSVVSSLLHHLFEPEKLEVHRTVALEAKREAQCEPSLGFDSLVLQEPVYHSKYAEITINAQTPETHHQVSIYVGYTF